MKVEREEFIATLARVKPALGSGGLIAGLSNIWFDGNFACAFNGGFGIKLGLKSDLACGVPGKPLMDLLGTSSLKETTLEQVDVNLRISLGKSTSKLSTFDLASKVWPYPQKLPKGTTSLSLNEDFIEGLRKSLFIKARMPTRVEEHGVMVKVNKSNLELYSTDTSTMARVIVKGAAKGASFERTLLPRDFAEQLVAQAPEGVDLYVLEDCLIAVGEGITFYSNVLDISGADDMGAIVDRSLGKHGDALPLPAGLKAALERAEILAGGEEAKLELATSAGALKLTGTYALGSLQETLTLEGKAPEAKMRVLGEKVKRALPYAESFSLSKDLLILRGEPDFVYVVASL